MTFTKLYQSSDKDIHSKYVVISKDYTLVAWIMRVKFISKYHDIIINYHDSTLNYHELS